MAAILLLERGIEGLLMTMIGRRLPIPLLAMAIACSDEPKSTLGADTADAGGSRDAGAGDGGSHADAGWDSPFGVLMSLYADRNHTTGSQDEVGRTVRPEDDPPYSKTTDIGMRWERIPLAHCSVPEVGEAVDFRANDNILGAIPPTLRILLSFELGDSECYDRLAGSFPKGEKRLTDWIEAVVERYDGDGVDDMPGLENPIHHFQIGNEMDIIPDPAAGSGPPRPLDCDAMTDMGLAEPLAHLQRIGHDAVKRADPTATVLAGGISRGECIDDFWNAFLGSAELAGTGLDVFDYHYYGPGYRGRTADEVGTTLESFRRILDDNGFSTTPIWSTENGTWARDPAEEERQARDLIQRYVYAMSFGTEKVFWAWALLEGIGDRNCASIFEFTGLIYDGYCGREIHPSDPPDPGYGVPKLGYFAHRKLAEVFEGFDVRTVARIASDEDVFAFRVTKGATPMWFVWTLDDAPKSVTLDLGTSASGATAIELVPRQSAGKDVDDYATAFDAPSVTLDASNDARVTIDMGDRPIAIRLP